MTAFENATKFFNACESAQGWDACKAFVADNADFDAQCEPLVDIVTVEAYCEWIRAFGTVTSPQATYTIHASSYDNDTQSAMFFATYHAKHTGAGGPVEPTHKSADSHFVYIFKINDAGKIKHMTKVWNAPWAMRQLGWI